MSGHSKWHNIRVKKTAQDAARGKIYTKHAKLIEIAAQRGPDPATNASLRTAIDNAKADNVPNANIDRAIKKGSGQLAGAQMVEEMYAVMGPGNAALLIECLTDNKNRALTSVKTIASKNGGAFVESASVLWMFARKGIVVGTKAGMLPGETEELELELIDFGAEDVEVSGETLSVTTDLTNWTKVRDFLKGRGYAIQSAGLKYVPTQKAEIKDAETARKLMTLVDAMEADDDVSEVHTNADISEEIAAQMG